MKHAPRLAVIGAGISGIKCARQLQEAGYEVVVYEKSRSLGGRCATRLWEGHVVDHGAQYFTARDEAFAAELRMLCGEDLLSIESPIFDARGVIVEADGATRWYHRQGNNRLGKAMAGGLTIHREHTLENLRFSGGQWQLSFTEGKEQGFSGVVLSCPAPQTWKILGLVEPEWAFAPCLTAFFLLEGGWPGRTREAYAHYVGDGHEGLWTACENHKAGRVQEGWTVLVAQASPGFSLHYLEEPAAVWIEKLGQWVAEAWGVAPAWADSFGHRWRYARRIEEVVPPDLPPGIFLTGDSLSLSRIQDVWQAGEVTGRRVAAWVAGT